MNVTLSILQEKILNRILRQRLETETCTEYGGNDGCIGICVAAKVEDLFEEGSKDGG